MAITYKGDYKAVVKEGPEDEPIIIFKWSDGEPIPKMCYLHQSRALSGYWMNV